VSVENVVATHRPSARRATVSRINWVRVAAQTLIVAVVVLLFAPSLLVALMSFNPRQIATFPLDGLTLKWWHSMFDNPAVWEAARLSLTIALAATVLSVALGLGAAYALTRPVFRLRPFLAGMLVAPMVAPALVVGVALLVFWNNLGIERGILTVVLAHTALALPYTTLVLAAGMTTLDPKLDEAAASLGATRWYALRRVTLPQLLPSIIAACAFAFTVSFDEFNVTYFVIGAGDNTLPIYIYSNLKFGITPALNAVATLALILSITLATIAFGRTRRVQDERPNAPQA
jgi:ABC-type spermidine/putrescine transport system permease subunit II